VQIRRCREQPGYGGFARARRSPEYQRTERPGLEQARQGAVGSEQMLLADHVGQLVGAQAIRQWTRCGTIEAGGREQVGTISIGPGAQGFISATSTLLPCPEWDPEPNRASAAQHHRHLLPATHDGDPPYPARLPGGTFEIAWLRNFLVIDGKHQVAALKAQTLGK
jgi:hypothetical protein